MHENFMYYLFDGAKADEMNFLGIILDVVAAIKKLQDVTIFDNNFIKSKIS